MSSPSIAPDASEDTLEDLDAGEAPSDENAASARVVVVAEGAWPERVDKLLADRLPDVTRGQIQRWIEEERVLVNGALVRSKDKIKKGSRIEVRPGPPARTDALPDPNVPILVLFEDAELIVVSKPAGLVVHPGRGHHTGTMVNGLLARPGFERPPSDPRDPQGQSRPGIVHRIDKDTSGILVVAKSERAREGLKTQFAAHSVERVYYALTVGMPVEGRIETLHGRDPVARLKFSSKVKQGKRAVTHVRVRERLAAQQAALVECRLETGRTHQIRVHLSAELGTPILADELYGGVRGAPRVLAAAKQLGRQALHAAVLGFVHPRTGEKLRFEEPLPQDFSRALEALRDV